MPDLVGRDHVPEAQRGAASRRAQALWRLALTELEGLSAPQPPDQAHLGGAWDWIWGIFRWPIAFVAILLFFALVYYLAPNVDVRNWKWITPGSLVGALLWLALSGLFALYVSFFGSYSKTYGSLAAGVILLLWLNYTAWAILFGAELNSELDRQADIRAAGGPHAGLTQLARRSS